MTVRTFKRPGTSGTNYEVQDQSGKVVASGWSLGSKRDAIRMANEDIRTAAIAALPTTAGVTP
jgi:hypothetical protein